MSTKSYDCVAFFCRELNREFYRIDSKLTFLLYLADWKSMLDRQKPLTNVEWSIETIHSENYLVAKLFAELGQEKLNAYCSQWRFPGSLNSEELDILEHVVARVGKLDQTHLLQLVNSTYPVIAAAPGEHMNLSKYSRDYKERKQILVRS